MQQFKLTYGQVCIIFLLCSLSCYLLSSYTQKLSSRATEELENNRFMFGLQIEKTKTRLELEAYNKQNQTHQTNSLVLIMEGFKMEETIIYETANSFIPCDKDYYGIAVTKPICIHRKYLPEFQIVIDEWTENYTDNSKKTKELNNYRALLSISVYIFLAISFFTTFLEFLSKNDANCTNVYHRVGIIFFTFGIICFVFWFCLKHKIIRGVYFIDRDILIWISMTLSMIGTCSIFPVFQKIFSWIATGNSSSKN